MVRVINIICPLNVAIDINTTSNITHIVAINNTTYYNYNNLSKYWWPRSTMSSNKIKRTKHTNSNVISHDTMHGHSCHNTD